MRGSIIPVVLLLCTWMALAAPREPYLVDIDDPEAVMEVLSRLGRSLLRRRDIEQSKRGGVDFGLGRGFSGTQAAKHLMGLAAANYAIGPGRKRRQVDLD